ncbi:MAG: PilZ domain-containing protein [Candidatus Eremiobacteraeota bacterium]|nr:PilZ domain-containing protein [Candidatus Eremiobacteraeota bacterium]MCW5870457.1 PilZ domain-containing protein [Candidatus Eremiobacteraeota bacterium]
MVTVPAMAPPPPPPELPPAPPSSDDWMSLIDTPPEPVKTPPLATPSPPAAAPLPPARTQAAPAPSRSQEEAPEPLQPGMTMRAIPEKQPSTPRGWNVKVLKTDAEGIWVARVPGENDPLPVAPKEVLSLVMFDERRQVSYDCPVIRVKAGNPEQVLVGRPLKSMAEKSKLDSLGGRQHFRIELQLPVEVKIPGLAGKSIPPLPGHTRDVSKGGLALTLARGFDMGRELEIRVLSWNFPLQIKARVVRCDEEANGRFTVAVAFPEEMSAITRDLVAHFIMENQRGR